MALAQVDPSLVTVGQPTEGGYLYAYIGTPETLPTDAVTALPSGFESVGYITENGLTDSASITSNKFGEWGGKNVLSFNSKIEGTMKVELEEINRPICAKLRYGSKNVETNTDGSVKSIKETAAPNEEVCFVAEEIESNGMKRRTVFPRVKVESVDDIAHQLGSLMVYGLTFTKLVCNDGYSVGVYRGEVTTA